MSKDNKDPYRIVIKKYRKCDTPVEEMLERIKYEQALGGYSKIKDKQGNNNTGLFEGNPQENKFKVKQIIHNYDNHKKHYSHNFISSLGSLLTSKDHYNYIEERKCVETNRINEKFIRTKLSTFHKNLDQTFHKFKPDQNRNEFDMLVKNIKQSINNENNDYELTDNEEHKEYKEGDEKLLNKSDRDKRDKGYGNDENQDTSLNIDDDEIVGNGKQKEEQKPYSIYDKREIEKKENELIIQEAFSPNNTKALNFNKKFLNYNKSLKSFRKINEIDDVTQNNSNTNLSPIKHKHNISTSQNRFLPNIKQKDEEFLNSRYDKIEKQSLFSNSKLKNVIGINTQNQNFNNFRSSSQNGLHLHHSVNLKKQTTAIYNIRELLKSKLNQKKKVSEYGLKDQENRRKDIIKNLVKTTKLSEVEEKYTNNNGILNKGITKIIRKSDLLS